jgi:hypothetical protein
MMEEDELEAYSLTVVEPIWVASGMRDIGVRVLLYALFSWYFLVLSARLSATWAP